MGRSTIGGYPLVERIGEGGIADVFRSEREGRPVAIKVLREPERSSLRRRFVREGRLLQRLSHPSLVRCLEVIEGEQPALVLELLRGRTLDDRVGSQPLGGDESVLLASALLRVLTYLHEQGIMHRDVKPSNVFMEEDRRVVLVDLGLAADARDPLSTTLGDVMGTYAYMAPEQIAGAEVDHRCDLYSLGITLYEAACGQRPYAARSAAEYLLVHRAGGATPLVEVAPSVPVRLATLVDRLMARDPAARPPSAAIALALLTGSNGVRRGLVPPRMIAREAALGAIEALLDSGGALRLVGEIGSGTGAVARAAREMARRLALDHVTLRCRPHMSAVDAMSAIAREIRPQVGDVAVAHGAVRVALAGLAAESGALLLVVEDLDLAEEEVSAEIEDLRTIPGLSLLVTGTTLGPLPRARQLALRALTAPEVRTLVGAMLGTPAVPLGLDAGLVQLTGGLPALVCTALREQVERGALWCEGSSPDGLPRWTWDPAAKLEPGPDMARRFDRALRGLSDASLCLLRTLAAAGEVVPLDLALRASRSDASGLALGPLVVRGLARSELDRGEEWIALRRAVAGPLILATMTFDERRGAHLALAAAARERGLGDWEQRFAVVHAALGAVTPEDTERLVELGDHLVGSGRPLAALEALDRAALLPLTSPRAGALRALARADGLLAVGRLDESREAVNAGRRLADEARDSSLALRATVTSAELLVTAGAQIPAAVMAEVAVLAEGGSPRGHFVRAECDRLAAELDRASVGYERALSTSGPPLMDRVAARARFGQAAVAEVRGDLAAAADIYRSLAQELRGRERIGEGAEALCRLALVRRQQGRMAAALEALANAERLVQQGVPLRAAHVEVTRAAILVALGDHEGADVVLRASAPVGARAPWLLRATWLEVTAELRAALGDSQSLLAVHLDAAAAAQAAGDRIRTSWHRGMAALLTADANTAAAAVEDLGAAAAHRSQASLLAAGARIGRDPTVLTVAEVEARASGDVRLLLDVLHAMRGPGSRAEARDLCGRMIESLYGPLRDTFLRLPAPRWALGEHGARRRDTGL